MQAFRPMFKLPPRCQRYPAALSQLLGLVAALAFSASCGIPIRVIDVNKDVPRTAIPIVVRAGLDTMDDPEIARRVQLLLTSPQMRAVQQEMVSGLVDGTLATLGNEARAERIGAIGSKAIEGILRGAVAQLAPELTAKTNQAISGALDTALSPVHQRQMERLVEGFIATTVHSIADGLRAADFGRELLTAVHEQFGPAFSRVMREEVMPGLIAELKNEELQRALGSMARVVGREMVIGAAEGLARSQQPKEDGSLLSRATELAHQGARFFGSAAWLLVLVIAALFAWTMKLLAQSRRYRDEADRRAATARLLDEATRAAEGKPWASELIATLQERIRADEEAIAKLRREKRAHV